MGVALGGVARIPMNIGDEQLFSYMGILGGGFKYFLCSPLFGEDFQFD